MSRLVIPLALVWIGFVAATAGLPDMRPEMPEVDGVHPLRAAEALRAAYAPGEGFVDKYPPLGSALMGAVGGALDPGFLADVPDRDAFFSDDVARRAALWPLRGRVALLLTAQRWVSRLAMAAAVALVALVAARLAGSATGGLLAGVLFGLSWPAVLYGSTTNVDALALAASLLAIERALAGRPWLAGAALGAAVALKDPAYALAPALLAHALAGRGRWRALLLGAALAYVPLSGMLLTPGAWREHAAYLLSGGVESVSARIDHGSLVAWGRLVDLVRRQLGDALLAPAWAGQLALLAGLVGLATLARRERTLLLGAFVGPIVFFVLPVGFCYPRFLLVPVAALAIGAGVLLARNGWVALAAAALVAAVGVGRVVDTWDRPWPRVEVVDAVATLLPDGGTVALFSGERRHGPALDPTRYDLSVHGLNEVELAATRWAAQPVGARPEVVLVLGFPTDPPDGSPRPPAPPPEPGAPAVGGMYRVERVLGAEPSPVDRAAALRPTISVLARVGLF